jgi:uncharacterized repeat protein (TIGR03803 family)
MHSAVAEGESCPKNAAAGPRQGSTKAATATRGALILAALFVLLDLGAQNAAAQTETVLHSFTGSPDGAGPSGGTPVMDKEGNLYGTTLYGGVYNNLGTVWKLTPSGTETVLWSFGNGADGASPAGVVMDKNGNLFGTTGAGGAYNLGTVFELTPSGTETVLWSFGNGTDGSEPAAPPVLDKEDNIYGTTYEGGIRNDGTVFELTPSGTETILWSFLGNGTDQGHPTGLMLAKNGDLYGTNGGLNGEQKQYGQVWEVMGQEEEKDLYSFVPPPSGEDGDYPDANVAIDGEGNLYGTCHFEGAYGHGTVFKLTPSGTETILHAFKDKKDGSEPYSNTLMDKKGNLFSVTAFGGLYKGGTVWRMTPSGKEMVFHAFANDGKDGYWPLTGVVLDKEGNIYGTTFYGGQTTCRLNGSQGCGTVYKITR